MLPPVSVDMPRQMVASPCREFWFNRLLTLRNKNTILSIEIKQRLSSLVSLGPDSFLFPLLSEGLTLSSTVPPFCNRTVAFFVLRDRVLSYASPSFAFPAALVPLSCLLLPLLVKPLRCCFFLALLCCHPLLVLVVVMLLFFHFFLR